MPMFGWRDGTRSLITGSKGNGRRLKDQRTLTLSHTERSGHRNPMVSKLKTTGTILLGIYTVGRVTVTVTVT